MAVSCRFFQGNGVNKRLQQLCKGRDKMSVFKKATHQALAYDREKFTPVIRCSICTGERVAGFRDRTTGKFTDVTLIKSERDLEAFRRKYGITGEIEKIY